MTEFANKTAHTIRTFGLDIANGDFTVDVDVSDAQGVLTFIDYVLREVYQVVPAELQRFQDATEARKMTLALPFG
jgi:cell division septum initiation protein DivIVA